MSVRGKLAAQASFVLDQTDSSTIVNNLLYSLFSQCSVTLNGVSISISKDLYNYRAFLELIAYGHNSSRNHLTNAFLVS
jgi:hypothetical protein